MEVGVVVAIYGDLDFWRPLAKRALASVQAQVPAPDQVEYVEAVNLTRARNEGLFKIKTEFVCHLDGDDELEPGYLATMADGSADVRVPSIRYVGPGRAAMPQMSHVAGHEHSCTADCLDRGNWVVVGAVARTSILQKMGGWHDYTWSEDWDFWVRAWRSGATFEAVPKAIYRAYVRRNSRNRAPTRAVKLAAHRAIAKANGLWMP